MGVSGVFSLHPTWIPLQGGTRAVGAPMTTNLSAEATLNEELFGGALRERRGGKWPVIFLGSGRGCSVGGASGAVGWAGVGAGWGRAIFSPGIFFEIEGPN